MSDYHQPGLFGDDQPDPTPPEHRARRADPDTSKAAAGLLTTGKTNCVALLRVHYIADGHARRGDARFTGPNRGLTDAEAAEAVDMTAVGLWKRCSDLRRLGLIEWLRNAAGDPITRPGPNGRDVRVSVITDAGRAELRDHHDRIGV